MSVPFQQRNPVIIGAISLAVMVAMMLVAFRAGDLPLIGGGDTYYAKFTDASGIKKSDEVRIAGVRVGKVTAVDLEGNQVRVTFKVKTPSHFGRQTGAEIKVKTLLGNMFLALKPAGPGQLDSGSIIPVGRTRSAYDVVDAFSGLAGHVERINVDRLRDALNALASATSGTPQAFQDSLSGVSALSRNIAARDGQLNTLLHNLHTVSNVLARHDGDIVQVMRESDVLMRALVARREAIHRLLLATSQLSKELTTLVRQTRADLRPALTNLRGVLDVLLKNQNNLDQGLRLMAPFYRVFQNTLGTGPWFDTWIQNVPPT